MKHWEIASYTEFGQVCRFGDDANFNLEIHIDPVNNVQALRSCTLKLCASLFNRGTD